MNASKVGVPEGSESKSYYKYYLREIAEVPAEKREFSMNPIKDMKDGLRINDRNKMFESGYLPGELGIFPLAEGGYQISNLTKFKNATGEMLQWWFAWHGADPLRYAIWDPYDHHGLVMSDEDKLKIYDPSLSYADKCREVHHKVFESLVPGTPPSEINIHFRDPKAMGFEADKIFTESCSFLVCANVEIVTPEGIPNVPVVMLHFARDLEDGCELRSRFWLGYQIIDGVGKCLLPPGVEIPIEIVKDLFNHNLLEFTNLATILPNVYKEEKDNWK